MQEKNSAGRNFDQSLPHQVIEDPGDVLPADTDAGCKDVLGRRRTDDTCQAGLNRPGKPQQFRRNTKAGRQQGHFRYTDSLQTQAHRQNAQQSQANPRRVNRDAEKCGPRQAAEQRAGQGRDAGRAWRSVDGRHLTEDIARTKVVQDEFLPARCPGHDAYSASCNDEHVTRDISEIE
ncbi:MAG: hypothetical protein U1E70_26005 [Acetobacteraceae bacterium]